ncbi:MAG: YIP1 family protein [Prevotellaceae bacterium]|nr:YIP1 family protein [Prevotellaceae bacterium]
MNFYFTKIRERIKGILFSPLKTWKSMSKESGYTVETVIFLFVCCLVPGLLTLVKGFPGWMSEIFIPFCTILISSILLRFIKHIRKISWEGNFNLTVYSFFPLLWCYALSHIFNYRQYLLPFGLLYSIILLFIACKKSINISFWQCLLLVAKIVLILFFCLYLLMVPLSG